MVSDADEDVFLSLEEDSAPKPAPLVKKTTSRKKPKPAVLSKPEKELQPNSKWILFCAT